MALNIDGINWRAPAADFLVFPVAGIDAESTLVGLARPLGLTASSASWQHGMDFAFDTKEFLAHGIVALTLWQGSRYRESEGARERMQRSTAIHEPADEFYEDWSVRAIEQHFELYRAVLEHYADGAPPPRLLDDNPFTPLWIGR